MATPKITLVPIVLDKARNLRMDFNALADAEELTGKNWLDGETWKGMTAKDVRALLFASLTHEDDKLTLRDVGAMLDPNNMAEVLAALEAAYETSMPEPPAEGAGEIPLAVVTSGE